MITGVAIKVGDEIISKERPARHGDLIRQYAALTGSPWVDPNDQGFIDDELGFVNRAAALDIAVHCGQVKRENVSNEYMLISQDLW